MAAALPITVAERVESARILVRRGAPLAAAICARWAGIALRESAMAAQDAANPFDGADEAALAHALAQGLAEGRRKPVAVKTWTPIPGSTFAAHAAGSEA